MKNLIKHIIFVLALASLLTFAFNFVYAQDEEEEVKSFPLGPMPKLIVFVVAVAVSIVTDTIAMGFLAGGFRPMRAITSSIPWAFVNVYWWDYIAPFVAGIPFLTMKFMQVGDPAWNYWVGSNVIVAFLGNLIMEQVVFRFARGAAASGWGMDLSLAALDAVMPIILFMILPMFGIF